MTASRGPWMQTFTGRKFYPLDPRPEEVFLEDIAHHLSMLCRFTGAVARFYSVAQHSVLVLHHLTDESVMVPGDVARWALLHDAAEAYLNDLNRPTKHAIGMQGYRAVEERVLEAVRQRFGLPPGLPPEVVVADSRMLFTERRDLVPAMQEDDSGWGMDLVHQEPYLETITVWAPPTAERMFLSTAARIGLRYAC